MSKEHLKNKILENPIEYLDSLTLLIHQDIEQAEHILQMMTELVREKKINPHQLYKHMESPVFFQDESGQDFTKIDPLIIKLIRDGGITFYNGYLTFKFGSPLSAELLALHDIFRFQIEPIKFIIDKTDQPIDATQEDVTRIIEKYYAVYGMTHELFGDILQEKNKTILKRLIECKFDFNAAKTVDHLKRYLYMHLDNQDWLTVDILQFLLNDGLQANTYLELLITALLDEIEISHIKSQKYPLIQLINLLFDHHATLSSIPVELSEKLHRMLEVYAKKIEAELNQKKAQPILESIWYLEANLVESLSSFEKAKPYYQKAGERGADALRRKELLHLLKFMKSLS